MPEHVSAPLSAAASELQNINIEKTQMKAPMAPFCVNLTLPYLTHDTTPVGTASIPFALPPLQENFQAAGTYDPDAPQMKLKSVSFSWDQRAEPAAIASQFWGLSGSGTADTGKYGYSSEQGKITYDDVSKLDITLSIHCKDQAFFGNAYPHKLQRELWSTVIPASGFAGNTLRANPFLVTDLDIAIDQHKTFVFAVSCPGLTDTQKRFLALPSIEVSMKFVCELMPRDSGQTDVQNIPQRGGSGNNKWGAKTGRTVTINTPAAGDAIEADANEGVEYNVAVIDDEFREKLSGGYDRFADVPPSEAIKDDAAYEVIAVPLFQNAAHGGISANKTYSRTWPYTGTRITGVAARGLFDRRIVPIHHSYTIHHAILAWNWTPFRPLGAAPGTTPIDPATSGLDATQQQAWLVCPSEAIGLKVGVGLGTGMSGDGFGYDEIAALALTDPNNTAADVAGPDGWGTESGQETLIDRIKTINAAPAVYPADGASGVGGLNTKWNWELHSLGLAGSGGTGYYAQGKPVFTGPGWTTTQSRSNLGGATPATAGAEQWIEVRGLLYPTDATKTLSNTVSFPTAGGSTIGDYASILVGYGGCYVYLICKKSLTS